MNVSPNWKKTFPSR